MHELIDKGVDEIEEDFSISWTTHVRILKCGGCASLSFRTDGSDDVSYDDEGRNVVTTKHYPPRIFRQQPQWLAHRFLSACPREVSELLNEAYVCMQNSCKRAAAMSIRAALERIMIQKVGDRGTFGKTLAEFQTQGYIAQMQRDVIEQVLEVGHASIHRGYTPSDNDLVLLFDVTETLVELVYVHQREVVALKKRIPKRKKPKQGKSARPKTSQP